MNFGGLKYIVVGAGFWGSVFAERLASVLNEKILVIDKRNHIGGNCYSKTDKKTGIECHQYGCHIFHTSLKNVWDYVNRFSEFNGYKHKVLILNKNKVYSMPVNLATINSYYNLNLTPVEAEALLKKEKDKIKNPKNFEEKAISIIGSGLYGTLIKNYTTKQWGTDPKNLSPEIIARLPVRTNYNDNYYYDMYQGIPIEGYTGLFGKILAHKNITVKLNTDYYEIKNMLPKDCKIIFTGMIDKFFDYKHGGLAWRSLKFKWKRYNRSDFQGNAAMHFADLDIPYTRIHEFKHYHTERTKIFESKKTVICYEYPADYKNGMEPYYPVNDKENNYLHAKYIKEAVKNRNIIIGGRLGSYQYWDMDKTIENALNTFNDFINKKYMLGNK
ncbi:MAG: UDP-galactopyranose mutase [Endomicrobiaceae bacterium]|nr:UDP-galactopyranose mutase [Endomicrobiaceae bacterium]